MKLSLTLALLMTLSSTGQAKQNIKPARSIVDQACMDEVHRELTGFGKGYAELFESVDRSEPPKEYLAEVTARDFHRVQGKPDRVKSVSKKSTIVVANSIQSFAECTEKHRKLGSQASENRNYNTIIHESIHLAAEPDEQHYPFVRVTAEKFWIEKIPMIHTPPVYHLIKRFKNLPWAFLFTTYFDPERNAENARVNFFNLIEEWNAYTDSYSVSTNEADRIRPKFEKSTIGMSSLEFMLYAFAYLNELKQSRSSLYQTLRMNAPLRIFLQDLVMRTESVVKTRNQYPFFFDSTRFPMLISQIEGVWGIATDWGFTFDTRACSGVSG